MPVRSPTLEEWFLAYQLERVKRDHFHLPFYLDADVTEFARAHEERGERPPVTALLVQAAGRLAEARPEANRVVFHTFLGMRILDPDYIAVNVPLTVSHQGRECLTATVVHEPQSLSLGEIRAELRAARARPVEELPVGRHVFGKPNTFLNRLRLRLIHDGLQNLPHLYERFGGGGLSVSSLMNLAAPDFPMRMMAYGPTALTIGCCRLAEEGERRVLHLGIAYDHMAFPGQTGVEICRELGRILAKASG